jgi:branched-subunit amino acid transport protein
LLADRTVLVTIVIMGIVTFLLRLSFVAFLGHVRLPALVRRGLDFVPPAVFSALILPDLLGTSLIEPLSLNVHARLIAGSVSVLVAWRTKNVVLTIGAGLVILWTFQSLL